MAYVMIDPRRVQTAFNRVRMGTSRRHTVDRVFDIMRRSYATGFITGEDSLVIEQIELESSNDDGMGSRTAGGDCSLL